MMQESGGNDNSFEIIENKNIPQNNDSVQSSNVTPIPMYNPNSIGNLLSSVPPPTALPNFVTATVPNVAPSVVVTSPISTDFSATPTVTQTSPPASNFYPTTFSAAIPPNKGTALGDPIPQVNPTVPVALDTASYSTLDDNQAGLFGWTKVSEILSKAAERARSSVGSMITTLDPQMREFIYSGGDIEILVASDREDVISPIREAFQSVFGRATIIGRSAVVSGVAAQTIGFKDALAAANKRIAYIHEQPDAFSFPTIAVESFIFKMDEDKWFDMDLLVLNDPVKQIKLESLTQPTSVPSTIVTLAMSETSDQYPFKSSGLAVKVATLLSNNLQVPSYEWHEAITGISRRTLLLNAAHALAGLYKSVTNQR